MGNLDTPVDLYDEGERELLRGSEQARIEVVSQETNLRDLHEKPRYSGEIFKVSGNLSCGWPSEAYDDDGNKIGGYTLKDDTSVAEVFLRQERGHLAKTIEDAHRKQEKSTFFIKQTEFADIIAVETSAD
jgi:hypothetical protein